MIELEAENQASRSAQEEVAAAHEHYFALFDLAPVGFFTISESGVILEVNRAAASLFGMDPNQLHGRPFSRFVQTEDQDRCDLLRKTLFETDAPQGGELCLAKPDGSQIWVRLEAIAARIGNADTSWCLIVMSDITSHKLATAERERVIGELRDTLGNAKTLTGVLPICSGCRNIRDDQGHWSSAEVYIRKHTDAKFTHGLCPICMKNYFPDYESEEITDLLRPDEPSTSQATVPGEKQSGPSRTPG